MSKQQSFIYKNLIVWKKFISNSQSIKKQKFQQNYQQVTQQIYFSIQQALEELASQNIAFNKVNLANVFYINEQACIQKADFDFFKNPHTQTSFQHFRSLEAQNLTGNSNIFKNCSNFSETTSYLLEQTGYSLKKTAECDFYQTIKWLLNIQTIKKFDGSNKNTDLYEISSTPFLMQIRKTEPKLIMKTPRLNDENTEFKSISCIREIKSSEYLETIQSIVKIRFYIKIIHQIFIFLDKYDTDLELICQHHGHLINTQIFENISFKILKGIQGFNYFEAIQLMHSKKFIHRDLKPSNIFVNNFDLQSNIDKMKIYIADLETAREIDILMTKSLNTLQFAPPEFKLFKDKYTESVDIWQLGMTFLQLANKGKYMQEFQLAFGNEINYKYDQIYNFISKIIQTKHNNQFDDKYIQMISQMLVYNKDERPIVTDIISSIYETKQLSKIKIKNDNNQIRYNTINFKSLKQEESNQYRQNFDYQTQFNQFGRNQIQGNIERQFSNPNLQNIESKIPTKNTQIRFCSTDQNQAPMHNKYSIMTIIKESISQIDPKKKNNEC